MNGEFRPVCPTPRLVRPVPVDPQGVAGPTRGQAQRGRWRPTTRGFYVPAWVSPEPPEQRALEQSLRLPAGGAVTGWAALRLAGAAYFDGRARRSDRLHDVDLVVPPSSRIRTGNDARVSREPIAPSDLTAFQSVPCTIPVRALFDEVRRAHDVREGVVVVDMTAAAGLVSIDELGEYHRSRTSWRRASHVSRVLALASQRSLSPEETRMRLVWVLDARLPPPLVNVEVFDPRGRLLGVADLLDAAAGVVAEYDGGTHAGPARRGSDAHREDLMRRAGLEYTKVVTGDLHHRARVVERLTSTRARALRTRHDGTGWTLRAPPGWRPFQTGEERLAFRDWVLSTRGTS